MTDAVVAAIFNVHVTIRGEMERVLSVKGMISFCSGGFQFTLELYLM